MGLAGILTACKTIASAVTGIKAAYDHTDMPEALDSAEVPAVLCLPNSGDMEASGAGAGAIIHTVRLILVGMAGGQGTVAQRMSQLVPYVPALQTAFAAHLALSTSGVEWATLERYAFITFAIGENNHAAVEFTLRVFERELLTVGV
jgi:hypothetical protein